MTSERQRAAFLQVAKAIRPPADVALQKQSEMIYASDGTINAEAVRQHVPYQIMDWYIPGTLAVTTNAGHEYVMPQAGVFTAVYARVKTIATGQSISLRITQNGTNIGPIIGIPVSTQDASLGLQQLRFAVGDIIRLNITQVGSTSAGGALSVNLIYRPDIVG